MSSIIKTFTCKLDGRQSLSIPIELKKYGRYLTEPVDVIINGYIKFEQGISSQPIVDTVYTSNNYQQGSGNIINDKTIIYPVLFANKRMTISNGRGVLTLIPRSEDILQSLEEIQLRAEGVWISDDDIIGGNVDEATVQILEDSKANRATVIVETGKIREPYKISIEVAVVDSFYYGETIDIPYNINNVEIPKESTTGNTTGAHYLKDFSKNAMINYYNNIDWLPYVESVLGTNRSEERRVGKEC